MHYTWVVIETYKDGFVWTHYYLTKQMAEWGIEDLREAHKGRTYDLVEKH